MTVREALEEAKSLKEMEKAIERVVNMTAKFGWSEEKTMVLLIVERNGIMRKSGLGETAAMIKACDDYEFWDEWKVQRMDAAWARKMEQEGRTCTLEEAVMYEKGYAKATKDLARG